MIVAKFALKSTEMQLFCCTASGVNQQTKCERSITDFTPSNATHSLLLRNTIGAHRTNYSQIAA
ncbi:MAG: hypothetical protein MHMPM18_002912 [Marteilia pararefringens]